MNSLNCMRSKSSTFSSIFPCRDGRSRCFGFVGFASIEDAAGARQYFNKTYMDTSRLEVEYAYKYGATNQRPLNAWSKYTQGTSAHRRTLQATGEDQGIQHGKQAGPKAIKKNAKKKPEEGRKRVAPNVLYP